MNSGLSRSGASKEEGRPPKGITIVQGQVLRIKRDNYVVRKYTGDVQHLYLADNSQVIGRVRPGDHIVAMLDDQRHVLLIQPN